MKAAVKIPRATCRLFGAIKAVSTLKETAILVHGPKGCVYHINYIMGMRGDRPSEIYSTCLEEQDVIFGAEDRLRTAISELDATLHPRLLIVLSCCASSIIGEDVESVIKDVHTDATVVGIESGGFEGDFRTGYSETLRTLVEQLVLPPDSVDPHSVNLIGMLRGGPDRRELVRLLESAGIRVNGVLTADATVEEIERLGSAALNVVVCDPAGREAAERLRDMFGTPYIIEEIPIGWLATSRFITTIGKSLNISTGEIPPPEPCHPPHGFLKDRRIAIISGPTRAVAMTRFFIEEGVEPKLIVADFDADTHNKVAPLVGTGCVVLIEPDQEEIIRMLRQQKIDLLIGGLLEKPLAESLGIEHRDIMHGSRQTVGYAGAMSLCRLLTHR